MRIESNQDNLDDGYARITLIKEASDATFYEEGDAIAIGRPDIKGATEFLCRKGGDAWAGRCESLSLNDNPSVNGDRVSFILQPGYVNTLALDPIAYTVYLVSADGQQKLETRGFLDFIPGDLPPSALQIIDSNDIEAKRRQQDQEAQRQREEAEEQKRLQAQVASQRATAQATPQIKKEETAPQQAKVAAPSPQVTQSPADGGTKKKKSLALLLAALLLLGGAAGGGYYYYLTKQKEKELAAQQEQAGSQEVFEEENPSPQDQQPQVKPEQNQQADQSQQPQATPDQNQQPQVTPEQNQQADQGQQPQASPDQNQQAAAEAAARLEAERRAAQEQEKLHRGNAKGRVADFFKGARSPEAAMQLAKELDADTSEQQDAIFRLYYYAADQENPQAALSYAQCLDPSKPAWGTVKKDAVEAYYYYGKTPEGEAERTRLKEWTKNEASQGNAQARKWLREMK